MMKIVKILAVLGDLNGQIQTGGGQRTFVPAQHRETVAAGEYAVVDSRSYDRSKLEGDAEGEFSGPAFTRDEVVHVGSFSSCVEIAKEAEINDRAANALLGGFVQKLSASLKAETAKAEAEPEMN